MCGIAGEINFKNGIYKQDYHFKMLDSMSGRGPDDSGIFHDKNAIL